MDERINKSRSHSPGGELSERRFRQHNVCEITGVFPRFGKQISTIRRLSTQFLNENHSCDTLQYQPDNAFQFVCNETKNHNIE
jgi:hypothetical protein